jgi:hypothetical protein
LAIILADYADLGRIFLNPFIIEQSRVDIPGEKLKDAKELQLFFTMENTGYDLSVTF